MYHDEIQQLDSTKMFLHFGTSVFRIIISTQNMQWAISLGQEPQNRGFETERHDCTPKAIIYSIFDDETFGKNKRSNMYI